MSQYFRILLSTLTFLFFFLFWSLFGIFSNSCFSVSPCPGCGLVAFRFFEHVYSYTWFFEFNTILIYFWKPKKKGKTCLTRFEQWKQLLTEPIRAGPTRFVSVKVSQKQTPDKMTCEVLIEIIALTATQARHSMMIGLVVMDTCPDIYSWLADLKPI